ncbi:MAG: hypothetical protein GY851_06680 [bacterium]|nr:hypothetical protein [bacterium]
MRMWEDTRAEALNPDTHKLRLKVAHPESGARVCSARFGAFWVRDESERIGDLAVVACPGGTLVARSERGQETATGHNGELSVSKNGLKAALRTKKVLGLGWLEDRP